MSKRTSIAIETPVADVRLVSFESPPAEIVIETDRLLIFQSLTPRHNIRGSFPRRWGSHRSAPAGDIIAVPPGEQVRIGGERHLHSSSLVCEVDASLFETLLDAPARWDDQRLEASLSIASPVIGTILRRLRDEMRNPGPASTLLIEHVVGQLAVELARYWDNLSSVNLSGGLAAWRLRLIDERLQRPGRAPSLLELSELCNISVRQLTRSFRVSRNVSLGEYVSASRMKVARDMLVNGASIMAVAHHVGFSSSSAFCTSFKRETGLSPGEFADLASCGKGTKFAN